MHPEGEAYPIQGGCAHVAWPGPGPEGRARTHTRSCPGERGFAGFRDPPPVAYKGHHNPCTCPDGCVCVCVVYLCGTFVGSLLQFFGGFGRPPRPAADKPELRVWLAWLGGWGRLGCAPASWASWAAWPALGIV